MLFAVLLELPQNQRSAAGRRPPMDGPRIVAGPVIAQMMKFIVKHAGAHRRSELSSAAPSSCRWATRVSRPMRG